MNAADQDCPAGFVEVDPLEVARRILANPDGWSRISVLEMRALAGFAELLADAPLPEPVTPILIDDVEVSKRAARAINAFNAFENARFSARERGARADFTAALKAISELIPEEISQ